MSETRKKIDELLKQAKENREKRHEYYENKENIPERIKLLLSYFGIDAKTLGLMIGVSGSTVKRWLRGQGTRRVNRLLTFRKLEELFLEYSNGPLKIGLEHVWYNYKNELLEYFTPNEYMAKCHYRGIKRVASLLNAIRYGFPT